MFAFSSSFSFVTAFVSVVVSVEDDSGDDEDDEDDSVVGISPSSNDEVALFVSVLVVLFLPETNEFISLRLFLLLLFVIVVVVLPRSDPPPPTKNDDVNDFEEVTPQQHRCL